MTARPLPDSDYRPSYRAAAIASLGVLALYLLTLGPSTAMWDTSEYIVAAYVMGLPHPPGNPFFVLLGRVFTILPFGAGPAERVNVLAALCSAASAGMWFLVTEHVLARWVTARWLRIAGASIAVLVGATAFTVWSQSVVNEKVYTIALFGVALISWLTVRWSDRPDGPRADRILVLIAYLLGLGYANHMAGFIAAPAVGLAVLVRRPRTVLRWRLLLACVGALTLGLTPFATQPIRSAYFPAMNEGEPTGCRTEFHWSCTFSAPTWDAFKYNFNREQFGKPDITQRQAPIAAQVGMWWTYFRWQWFRDAYDQMGATQAVLAALFLVLGLFGGWTHWKRDRQSFWFFGPLMLTLTLLLIVYLNFKYGYSQETQLGDTVQREVRERDYFYLWSFSAWSVWAALGLLFVWESVAALLGTEAVRVGKETAELPRSRSWALASPILGVALIPLFANWQYATRRGDTTTRDFAHDMLNSVEPYGVLVTMGDNDTFPLWYAQNVEGIRKDVVIAITSLMNTDWYVRQLIRAPIPDYDAAKGPEMYRGKVWPKPTTPPLKLTLDEADALPLQFPVRDTTLFEGPGDIRAKLGPQILDKATIAVLRMIKDSPERPMYFGITTGNYAEGLGLGPWLLRQGLARKLVHQMPTVSRDTLLVAGEGFVDVARTRDLWLKDSLGPQAIIRKNGWPDRASLNVPVDYLVTGAMLSQVLKATRQDSAARIVLAQTRQIARATRLDNLMDFNALSDSASPIAPVEPTDTGIRQKRDVPTNRDSSRRK
jgi:transmembrane protein TMEM260 (protein O-mannosyltransferase)